MELDVTGGRIAYDLTEGPVAADGGAPALLLLHAFPLHRGMWDPLTEELTGDAPAASCVIRMDCRGFGESPPGADALVMEQIAEDAVAVLAHEGIDRAVVCGLSMGGYAALALARRHPDRLCGLILADTRAEPDGPEARAARAETAVRVRREGTGFLADELPPKLLGATTRSERPEVVEQVREMIRAAEPAAVAHALEGMALRPDSRPFLEDVTVPSLVLVGDEDELTPVEAAETLRDGIPDARLEVLTSAGHLASLEAPEAFGRTVASFLRSLTAGRSPAPA